MSSSPPSDYRLGRHLLRCRGRIPLLLAFCRRAIEVITGQVQQPVQYRILCNRPGLVHLRRIGTGAPPADHQPIQGFGQFLVNLFLARIQIHGNFHPGIALLKIHNGTCLEIVTIFHPFISGIQDYRVSSPNFLDFVRIAIEFGSSFLQIGLISLSHRICVVFKSVYLRSHAHIEAIDQRIQFLLGGLRLDGKATNNQPHHRKNLQQYARYFIAVAYHHLSVLSRINQI